MFKGLKSIFLVVCLLILIGSCKKRKEGWNIDALIPVIDSKLDLQHIFEDDLVKADENQLLNLVYENEILNLKLADDFQIPDTTITQDNPGPSFNLVWDKKNPLISDTNESKFEITNANLTEARIASGKIKFKVSSTITEPTIITYNLSSAFKDGKQLIITKNAPAGSPSNPAIIEDEIDLSGYLLDLRGKDKNDYNTISYYFTVRFADELLPDTTYIYNQDDVVSIVNSFEAIQPEFVKGVFLTTTEKPDESASDFDAFSQITSGSLEVKKASFAFNFENYIGVDLQGQVNALTAINTKTGKSQKLTGDFLTQSLNLSRAKEDYSLYQIPIIPGTAEYKLDESNSNITDFIQLMPDQVNYDLDFTLNPLGNISGGNDFLFADYGIKAFLNMRIPLNIKANNLQLVDTVDFDLGEADEGTELIEGGYMRVHAENYYPFEAKIQIYTLNAQGVIIDSLMESNSVIDAGIPVNGKVVSPTKSVVSAPINPAKTDLLYQAERAIVKLTFNTVESDFQDIYSYYTSKVDVVGDVKYRLIIK